MARLGSPLVYDLLEVADALSQTSGRTNLRKAALRRAVSTAYYAVFHALCYMCASELVGWAAQNSELEPIYRLVEHGSANKLLKKDAAVADRDLPRLGLAIKLLKDRRHSADYAPPGLAVSRDWVLEAIGIARQTVEGLELLSPGQRRRLAVLLITRPRTDQPGP